MEGNQAVHKFWHQLILPLERDAIRVGRQVVEGRTIQAREGLQPVQSILLIKHFGVALKRMGRIEDAGTTAGGFFAGSGMRGGISAEEEAWISACGRPPQSKAMLLPFDYGQAVEVAAQAAKEHGVAVDLQVMGGDRGR